jgi:hypothetical protein
MLLAFTIACSDDGGEASDENVTPSAAGDTRPADYSAPPQGGGTTDQPPVLIASGAAGDVTLGGGSYCWGGRCVDTIEPTSEAPLSVTPGADVILTGFDWSTASELAVSARDSYGTTLELDATITGSDAGFTAPAAPDTYVVFVFMRTADGNDASYGLALTVE